MARTGGGAGRYKKKDKYGVAVHKKPGSSKRHTGTRQMKGKSGGDAMYVYNRRSGTYRKTTKAQVKKLEKSGGVGSTKDSQYRLVTKGTYEKAKKQKLGDGASHRKGAKKAAGGNKGRSTSPRAVKRRHEVNKARKKNPRPFTKKWGGR